MLHDSTINDEKKFPYHHASSFQWGNKRDLELEMIKPPASCVSTNAVDHRRMLQASVVMCVSRGSSRTSTPPPPSTEAEIMDEVEAVSSSSTVSGTPGGKAAVDATKLVDLAEGALPSGATTSPPSAAGASAGAGVGRGSCAAFPLRLQVYLG